MESKRIIVTEDTTLKEMFDYGSHVNMYNQFHYYQLPFWFEKQKDGIFIAVLEKDIPKHLKEFLEEKPLDQQDIEELGWRYDGKTKDEWYSMNGVFEIDGYTSFILRLQYGEDKRLRIVAMDCGGEDVLFKGTIRNKSELKKVMDMVGVATDNTLLE